MKILGAVLELPAKQLCQSSPFLKLKILAIGRVIPHYVDYLVAQSIYTHYSCFENMKILGTVLKLPAKQLCQSSPFTSKLGQIGQIGSAV